MNSPLTNPPDLPMAPITPQTHQPGLPDTLSASKIEQNDRPQEPRAVAAARVPLMATEAKVEQALDSAEDWYRSMANIPNQNAAGELQLSSYFRHINWLYGDCAITHARPHVLARLRLHSRDEPEMAITALTELGKVYYCREVELVSRFPRRFDPIQTSSSGFYATTLHRLTTFIVAETTRPMRPEIQYHSDITWINVADTARECHDVLMRQSTQDLSRVAAAVSEGLITELSESSPGNPEQPSADVNPKSASIPPQLATETDRAPEPLTPVAEREDSKDSPQMQQSSPSPSEPSLSPSPPLSPEFAEATTTKRRLGRSGSGHANEVSLAGRMTSEETGMNNPKGACGRCVQRFAKQWRTAWKASHNKTEVMPDAPPVPAGYCRVLKERAFAKSVRCSCCAVGHDKMAVCNVANALERSVLSDSSFPTKTDAIPLWDAVMRLCNGDREAADRFADSMPAFPGAADYTKARREIEQGIRRGPTWDSINTTSSTTRTHVGTSARTRRPKPAANLEDDRPVAATTRSRTTSKRKREAESSSSSSTLVGRAPRKPRRA